MVRDYIGGLFYEGTNSACNHDPDMSPSKPVRPQVVNELSGITIRAGMQFLAGNSR
jgi:hypothetical protein